DSVSSAEETKPFETDEFAATPPPPRSPQTNVPLSMTRLCRAWMTVRPQTPLSASTEALIVETDILEAEMPPRKRVCFTAPTRRFKVRESLIVVAARQTTHTLARRIDYGFIDTLDAKDRSTALEALIRAQEARITALEAQITTLQTQHSKME
ncbi:hypothetical protein Tco_1526429, partial [Tanacetum coccineum]